MSKIPSKINFKGLIPILRKSGVKEAGVFGSYIKGKKKPNDIDILIKLKKPIGLFKFVHLENELSQKLNRPVDLVTKNALSPYIRDEILKQTEYFYVQK
jgi:predicted nucleotidyltransferase